MRILKLLFLLLPLFSFSQTLVGEWYISRIINEGQDEYTLYKIEEKDNEPHYGNILQLKEDHTFSSFYSAPCGNDCFPSSFGTYEIKEDNRIHLFIEEFYQNGMCEEIHKVLNKSLGDFLILKEDENTIQLKKITENKAPEQQNKKASFASIGWVVVGLIFILVIVGCWAVPYFNKRN